MSRNAQDEFFKIVAKQEHVRVRTACIVIEDGMLLAQRAADDAEGFYAFVGGAYEKGDTFDTRIRTEFDEELGIAVVDIKYLFVVENRFYWNGLLIHSLEHFHEVQINTVEVESKEPHISFHWLPVERLKQYDLRPYKVRDLIAEGRMHAVRHIVN